MPVLFLGALIVGFMSGGIWGAIGAVILLVLGILIFGAFLNSMPEDIKKFLSTATWIGAGGLVVYWLVNLFIKPPASEIVNVLLLFSFFGVIAWAWNVSISRPANKDKEPVRHIKNKHSN